MQKRLENKIYSLLKSENKTDRDLAFILWIQNEPSDRKIAKKLMKFKRTSNRYKKNFMGWLDFHLPFYEMFVTRPSIVERLNDGTYGFGDPYVIRIYESLNDGNLVVKELVYGNRSSRQKAINQHLIGLIHLNRIYIKQNL